MYFIHELPENVVNLLYELAALSVKSSYPEYDRKKIDDILIDFENEKIKDVIPLLREYAVKTLEKVATYDQIKKERDTALQALVRAYQILER